MFGFQPSSKHVSKDVIYGENKVVISSIYQVPCSIVHGLHWMVNVGRYRIASESLLKNYQDMVLMLGTIRSITNVVMPNIEVKNGFEDPLAYYQLMNPLP
jgi:hypothetical protein